VTSVFICAISPVGSPTRRAFRPPAGGRVTFLCLSKERVTKRKDPPESAPCGCANGLRGFSTAPPVLAKNWLASVPATLRAVLHPFAALYGAPGRARAARGARTIRCRFAPVEQPRRCALFFAVRSLLLLFSFCSLLLSSSRSACPARKGSPYAVSERGGEKARRGIGRDANSFSPGQEPCPKAGPPLTPRRAKPGEHRIGVPFLWVTFLWARKEK
jgi:hypothetical protein